MIWRSHKSPNIWQLQVYEKGSVASGRTTGPSSPLPAQFVAALVSTCHHNIMLSALSVFWQPVTMQCLLSSLSAPVTKQRQTGWHRTDPTVWPLYKGTRDMTYNTYWLWIDRIWQNSWTLTTAVLEYLVALLTPSSCKRVFTTSKGVVRAADTPPAVPPAASCTANDSSSCRASSFLQLS